MKTLVKTLKLTLISIGVLAILTLLFFGYSDIPLDELKPKYAQSTSEFLALDGMEVHYRDEGPSEQNIPIVLIHGTGSSLHTFDDWVEELKNDYRVIRMDLPGYGLTGPFPNRDYSIKAYVAFLKNFLDEKGIDKCILGGNSLGGEISWRFALEYPQWVDKLILIDAVGYPYESESEPAAFTIAKTPVIKHILTFITPKSIARTSVENVYADKSLVSDELVNRYFELTLATGNRRAFVDRFSAKKDPEAYKNISSIAHPTLVLWGEQDRLIPVENAELFHRDLPNDTLVILKDVGHVPMEESPLRSLKPVRSFLESTSFQGVEWFE